MQGVRIGRGVPAVFSHIQRLSSLSSLTVRAPVHCTAVLMHSWRSLLTRKNHPGGCLALCFILLLCWLRSYFRLSPLLFHWSLYGQRSIETALFLGAFLPTPVDAEIDRYGSRSAQELAMRFLLRLANGEVIFVACCKVYFFGE